jgi:DNA-damage-inducible protein D
MKSFMNAINRAISTCNTLTIPIFDNFVQIRKDGIEDFKLSRFACYLVVMNADVRKYAVANAQQYFAQLAGAVQNYWEEVEKIDRLAVREEISEREKSLTGVVKIAGVQNYAYFQNAGYRGLYNMNLAKLKLRRQIPENRSLLDYMGKDELAANLFRITQTELKIKNENIQGQNRLEVAAENVGMKVRATMQEISGTKPENLPVKEDLKVIKKDLKVTSKKIKDIDKKKKGK